MSVLRAENFKKSFKQRVVVNGVNIEVKSGEIICMLGRNGAGKTTTFQMIVGLLKPDNGNIYLDDEDISRYSTWQRADVGITYLPQENSVFLKASTENNLKLILELKGKNKKNVDEQARKLLTDLGLSSQAKQFAYTLSGGERRRLEICRSLALEPKFILLDEPFTGIDPLTIIELQKIMIRLKSQGIGIIISDHNVRDTLKISDRAYIIDQGEILVEGPPQAVADNEIARERFLGKQFSLGSEIKNYSSRTNR